MKKFGKVFTIVTAFLLFSITGIVLTSCGKDANAAQKIHEWSNWEMLTPASCTEPEVDIRHWTDDPSHFETKNVGEALGHDYEWTITKPATETIDGVEQYMCDRCGDIDETKGSHTLYATGTDGLIFQSAGNAYVVTEYNGTNPNVFIPAYHYDTNANKYLAVVGVLGGTGPTDGAFRNNSVIENLTFTSCVTNSTMTIGIYAFRGCSNLKTVIISDRVSSIGLSSFMGCGSLESITVPYVGDTGMDVPNQHTNFGYMFGASDWASQTAYTFPASLKTVIITGGTGIAQNAFCNCSSLETLVIPTSMKNIYVNALLGCNSLNSVLYCGTPEDWDTLFITGLPKTATVYFYSEFQPVSAESDYLYWHWLDNSIPTVWDTL